MEIRGKDGSLDMRAVGRTDAPLTHLISNRSITPQLILRLAVGGI